MPSSSERQRMRMGAVLSQKRGENRSASPAIKEAARSMTTQAASDFARKPVSRSKRRASRSK